MSRLNVVVWRARFERAIDWLFAGEVSPWVYALMRVALAAILLVRQSDVLRPVLQLEHHRWVKGLDFAWSTAERPYLSSPLLRGFDLGEMATNTLVYARTALALLMLFGVRPRAAAALLAAVSYTLLLSDRYHYFHHLHLLYLSIAWLSLAPLGDRLNLERALRRGLAKLRGNALGPAMTAPDTSAIWPLQLVRALVISVYLAAGLAKLDPSFIGGETLEQLTHVNVLKGSLWTALHSRFGYENLAKLVCATELGLPLLLAIGRTRRPAVLVGWTFHALVSATMDVSSFGAQMSVLLVAFWPNATHVSLSQAKDRGHE